MERKFEGSLIILIIKITFLPFYHSFIITHGQKITTNAEENLKNFAELENYIESRRISIPSVLFSIRLVKNS